MAFKVGQLVQVTVVGLVERENKVLASSFWREPHQFDAHFAMVSSCRSSFCLHGPAYVFINHSFA